MACQISYDTIKALFFKSLAYDKTTYNSYKNMLSSIFQMPIDAETKVHTAWYMGILYNQAIKHDSEIITDDLPLEVSLLVVDKLNDDTADFDELLDQVSKLISTDAKADIERKKSLSQALIGYVWDRLAKQGISNADDIIGTTDTIDNIDFDKFWSNVTKEDLQNLKKSYQTQRQKQLDLYNKFKGEFDPSTGTITSNDTSFFDNKIKNVDAELAALGDKNTQLPPPPSPKPVTLKQKVKSLVNQALSGKVADIQDAVNAFVKLTKSDPTADSELLKEAFRKDITDIITRKTRGSTKASLIAYLDTALPIKEKKDPIPTKFVNISQIPGLGKGFHIVRQEDGTLIETVWSDEDQKYYVYDDIFDGTNFQDLEEYDINQTDYIVPIQSEKVVHWKLDNSFLYLRGSLGADGVGFANNWIVENEEDTDDESQEPKKNHQIISDAIAANSSLSNRLVVVADRRRININKERLRRINSQFPSYKYEADIRPAQAAQLVNKGTPVLTFIRPTSGVQLTLELKGTPYFSYINSLDNIGFVYPNGDVRFLNWDDPGDLNHLKAKLKIQINSNYKEPSDADIMKLRDSVMQVRSLKDDIIAVMGDAESFQVPKKLINKYLDVFNATTSWELVEETRPSGRRLSALYDELLSSRSTFKATVISRTNPEAGTNEEDIVAIVSKNPKVENGFEFINPVSDDKIIVDDTGAPVRLKDFYKSNGVDFNAIEEVINSTPFRSYYLFRTPQGWTARPMQAPPRMDSKYQKVSFFTALMGLKGLRPEYSADDKTALVNFIQQFNNSGWGFNVYRSLAANIDYIRETKNSAGLKDYIFGIRLRATSPSFPNQEDFNKRNLVLEFPFNGADVNRLLQPIYKVFNVDINNVKTIKDRVLLGQRMADKLLENEESISPDVQSAINALDKIGDDMIIKLGKQLETIIDKNIDVIADPNALRYLLFENISLDKKSFKLRSAAPNSNPLNNYMIFEKGDEAIKKSLVISLHRNPIVPATIQPTPVAPNAPSPEKIKQASNKPVPKKRDRDSKVHLLVQSLDGIKSIGDTEWNAQVDEIKRLLGNRAEIQESDLLSDDVKGIILGYFEDGIIHLNNKIKAGGVAYHEAFHGVFRMAFRDADRQMYLNAVKTISGGIQSDARGKYIQYKGTKEYVSDFKDKRGFQGVPDSVVENLIYEEFLAEDFKAYKESGVKPINKLILKLLNILDKILNFFSSKRIAAQRAIRGNFRAINAGSYANVVGDPYTAPRAYELAAVPSYIDASGTVQSTTVTTEVNDQLKNRIVYELLRLPSGEINRESDKSFNDAYDKVTKDLIAYFNIPEKTKNLAAVKQKYEAQFRQMRFMMGAAFRSDIGEQFVYQNNSADAAFDDYPFDITDPDNLDDAVTVFEEFRDQVKKDYLEINLINEQVSEEEDEKAVTESSEEEGDDIDAADSPKDIVGDRFDDSPYYKPFDGNANFKKLFRYIKYEYTDPDTGFKYEKMVNSKSITETISKVLANVSMQDMISTLETTVDNFKDSIDQFYKSGILRKNLKGKIPLDMQNTIDMYYTLKATVDLIKDLTAYDPESKKPSKAAGIPFYNMFHKVFNNAILPVISVGYNTQLDVKDTDDVLAGDFSYYNSPTAHDLVQTNNIKRVLDTLTSDIINSLNNITAKQVEEIKALFEQFKYITPKNKVEFDNIINTFYSATSIAGFNIPRTVFEFVVAADAMNNNTLNRSKTLQNIIDTNYDYYEDGYYFNPSNFQENFLRLINGYNINKQETSTNLVYNFVNRYYRPAAAFQTKYSPAFSSTRLLNLDNKPINQLAPYSPDVALVHQFKKILYTQRRSFSDFVGTIDPGLLNWFKDNPFFSALFDETELEGTDESITEDQKNTLELFFQRFKIAQSGGFFQETQFNKKTTTQKTMGDKSYMLWTLGLFANRKRYLNSSGKVYDVFMKPITTYEATSTLFMSSALYDNYLGKDASEKIRKNYKAVIKQEYNRIKNEYAQRYDTPIHEKWEGYNVKTNSDATLDVDDIANLRAYKFNRIRPLWTINPIAVDIENLLIQAATQQKSFEDALQEIQTQTNTTIERGLDGAIDEYAKNEFNDFIDYLKSLNINLENDIPASIVYDTGEKVDRIDIVERKKNEKILNDIGERISETSAGKQMDFLKDFFYNYHYNALFINQLFDGDYSIGIGSFVNYFKRKKSGVASGLTYENAIVPQEQDYTVVSVIKAINGYIDPANPQQPVSTNPEDAPVKINMADGQTWTSINRRIKKGIASGLLSDELVDILKAARYRSLTYSELSQLSDEGIYLNSDKPVVAHPLFYLKDSEHMLLRTDNSYLVDEELEEVVEQLYAELDDIDPKTNPVEYREIMREIHSYFRPMPGRALLHHFLNALEYYDVDKLSDGEVSKKASRPQLVIDVSLLDDDVADNHPVMSFQDQQIPTFIDNSPDKTGQYYINLDYNKQNISNIFVYEQVKVSESAEIVTDPIQENLHIPNQITVDKYPHLKKSINNVKTLQETLAKSRKETLSRLFKTNDVRTLLTKMIQSGLLDQSAAGNILKFYELDKDGKPKFNLNLPNLGKTPLYYFFSLYNKTLFSPKVAGKKYIHAAPVGYKLVIDKNGEIVPRHKVVNNPEKYAGYDTRYPTVEIKDGKVYVEVIIPRELAATTKERRFFEKLYAKFLGSRIPVEGKRSSVVVKVVDYIDAAYNNTIILPSIVHYWAGSDMDVDAVYSKRYDYYTFYKGSDINYAKYGEYEPLMKEYGLTQTEAKFIEYLYFTANDPAFKELISGEKKRLKDDVNLKALSMKDAAESFTGKLKSFFDGITVEQFEGILKDKRLKDLRKGVILSIDEDKSVTKKKEKKATGLESLKNLMSAETISADKETSNAIKLLQNLVAAINILKANDLPSTPEQLEKFSKKYGNPVTSVVFNELLDAKMDLLSDEKVQQDFVFNESADKIISDIKQDKQILEKVTLTGSLENSDLSSPQSVGRVRKLNSGSKRIVGYLANLVKGAILISTAKVKLSNDYTFKVIYQDETTVNDSPTSESVKRTGNFVGVATDDGKNQVLGPLSINAANASALNAMNIYGYPEQFTRIIHSVDLITKTINDYLLDVDPGYTRPGQTNLSFSTYLNNTVSDYLSSLSEDEKYAGISVQKEGVYKINPEAFTIDITDITSEVDEATPSGMGIRILDKKGQAYSDDVASIILLGFYAKMLEVGNGIAFNFSTVTNVLKSIKPSFKSLERIRRAAKYLRENNIFVGSEEIYKAYPILKYLIEEGIEDMDKTSRDVLLDQTNLFKGIISTFDVGYGTDADEISMNLKSIIGFSALQAYTSRQVEKIDPTSEKWLDQFTLELAKAFTTKYWLENDIDNDLAVLKSKFDAEENEFLRVISSKPVLYKNIPNTKNINVLASNVGNKVLPETQNKLINDFYALVNHPEQSVRNATLRIAAHGLIKDGGIPRQGSYLRIIAPELFGPLSQELDLIQEELAAVDNNPKIKTAEQYITALDKAFAKIYKLAPDSKTTSTQILNGLFIKMVAVTTVDAGINERLSMSFAQPGKFRGGKYADIDLKDFVKIVDTILPRNKKYVYRIDINNAGNKVILPAYVKIKSPKTKTKSRFELWKVNEDGELFFDLANIDPKLKATTDRILKAQGIYYSARTNQYSFPVYQINTYEGGQLFVLDTIDGKPFNANFFTNLFNATRANEPFESLLRGKTATYKIVERQGVDRIAPHALKNSVAADIRKAILGQKSLSSEGITKIKKLPITDKVNLIHDAYNLSILSEDKDVSTLRNDFIENYQNKTFIDENYYIKVGSQFTIYTVSAAKSGKLYKNNKLATPEEEDQFANKMGYANMSEFISVPDNVNWLTPKFGVRHILLASYVEQEIPNSQLANITDDPILSQDSQQPAFSPTYTPTAKTQVNNVVVHPIYDQEGKLDYTAMQKYAKDNGMVYSLRLGGDKQFGNPFGENKNAKGLVKNFNTIEESVQAYYDWLTSDKYDAEFPELAKRKEWILSVFKSGILKGKKILYWKELNKASHANVLDQLIRETEVGSNPPASTTPEFDKLPVKTNTRIMTYAGVGSRETPKEVLDLMTKAAEYLESLGYTLRSGGAKGADSAFEKGVKVKKEIFPGDVTTGERELKIAEEIHPAWNAMLNAARNSAIRSSRNPDKAAAYVANLMARNTNQIFGANLDSPVDFVLAWTKDGAVSTEQRTAATGGTGQAIDMASRKGIPVINMFNPNWREELKAVIQNVKPAPEVEPTKIVSGKEKEVLDILEKIGEKNFNNILDRYKSSDPNIDNLLIVDVSSYDSDEKQYNDTISLNYKRLVEYLKFNQYLDDPIDIWKYDDNDESLSIDQLLDRLTTFIADVNPNLIYKGLQEIPFPTSSQPSGVKVISEDYGVIQAETNPTKERTQEIIDLIAPQIKKQAYKENIGVNANWQFSFGKMWSRVNLKAQPLLIDSFAGAAQVRAKIEELKRKGIFTDKSAFVYDYHAKDQNGNALAPISDLQPLISEIEKTLGISMKDYDSVLGNIYLDKQSIAPHRDTTESKSAKGYPVVVYTIGNDAGLGIWDNNKGGITFANAYKDSRGILPTNEIKSTNGTIYTFGMDGKGRFNLTHTTPLGNIKKNSFPPITLSDGRVITNYTITLTFRRAGDLTPGMPTAPAKLTTTQPSTQPTVSNISSQSNPINIYSDGSDIKGTGRVGFGAVYQYKGNEYGLTGTEEGEDVKELQKLFPNAKFSNPTMEMLALVKTLETFQDSSEHLSIFQDYKGAVNYNELWNYSEGSAQREPKPWKAKEDYIIHLVNRAVAAIKKIEANGGSVKINWIKGHSGNMMNERADFYAKSRDNFNKLLGGLSSLADKPSEDTKDPENPFC